MNYYNKDRLIGENEGFQCDHKYGVTHVCFKLMSFSFQDIILYVNLERLDRGGHSN